MFMAQQAGAISLLWLAGCALRLTILAIPPVIALIKDDFNLTATEVGVLTGLPICLFAIAAVPGSLLIARLDPLSTVIVGIFLTALGSGLRSVANDLNILYATTILMGCGVAITQPALPPLVRSWLPDHVGFGTAVYTNGLIAGQIIPVVATPLVLPVINGSWRLSLLVWSLAVLCIAILIVKAGPGRPLEPIQRMPWWPDWRESLIWQLGLIFGTITSIYFTTNAFLPIFLSSAGRPDLIRDALIALNLGQLPASLLLLALANRLVRRKWPYILAALGAFASICALVSSVGSVTPIASATLGFCCGSILTLAFALPPLLCAPEDVARTSAAMLTLSYSCAVLVPIASGALWDLTGIAGCAFLPIGLCALLLLALASKVNLKSTSPNPTTP
jgi:MFS transporter, CP family, cyanate transporter